ncbi:hypothetical protein [Xenorhabdus doucetiae]|nr:MULTISPECIES: hypothetical protein [Xenorhabdus]
MLTAIPEEDLITVACDKKAGNNKLNPCFKFTQRARQGQDALYIIGHPGI